MNGFDEPFLPGVSLSNRRGGVMRQPFCDFTFRLVGRSVRVVSGLHSRVADASRWASEGCLAG